MKNNSASPLRRRTIFSLTILAVLIAVFALPFLLRFGAASGEPSRTESHDAGLPNYDIRTDKAAFETLAAFRNALGRNAAAVADQRQAMVSGEEALRQRVPTLKVEYNSDMRIPEIISPDVKQGRAFLTRPSSAKRSDVLKSFLNQNADLVGSRGPQVDELKVYADYTNPDGNLS
ncbi:MAG: hypothetical protein ABIV21_07560, partial [Pyrinomonadaceae bacterium]